MDINTSLIGTFLSVASSAFNVNAPLITTETQIASFPFTPYISQAEACKQAENKAKTLMLEKTVGQLFTSDTSQACKEKNNQYNCVTYNVSLESVRGEVIEVIDKKEKVDGWQCQVSLTAKVSRKQEVLDPNYDINIRMHQLVYMEKDTLRFSVSSNSHGALTIFRLNPNNNTLTKIWPLTSYQQQNNLLSPWMRMDFPNDFARLPIQQYLKDQDNNTMLFIAYTAQQAHFLDNYELTYFYKLWDSLKYQKRLLKKGYIVTRSE